MRLFKRHRQRADDPPSGGGSAGSSLTREVAAVADDLYAPLAGYGGTRPNTDPLTTRREPDSAYHWPYGSFEEALDKDAHLSALVLQRKAAVLGWRRRIEPGADTPAGHRAAELAEAALTSIGAADGGSGGAGIERGLAELLDAVPFGLAVSEVIWRRSVSGGRELLLPVALKSRHPRRFIFGTDGTLRLLTPAEPLAGEPVPPRKFIAFAPYGRHEDPYGLPALKAVWWLAYFKRQVLRFWVLYCEKFGTPTAVLKHPLSASEREKAAYRRIIGSIQQETGLVVPEGVEVEFLEAERQGSALAYRELVELCNREMSKALVGQTLSSDAPERGSYALGQVHAAVRGDIVRQDAQALAACIGGQLLRWVVELNLPAGTPVPRLVLTPPVEPDTAAELAVDRYFAETGLSQDAASLYQRYGRTPAAAAEVADED